MDRSGRVVTRVFLSTPSARRATCGGRALEVLRRKFLSTPSARRATGSSGYSRELLLFLSTPSARRATQADDRGGGAGAISIHALREEGDATNWPGWSWFRKFLSTPSARRATFRSGSCRRLCPFLSTPSARRATKPPNDLMGRGAISIHALREEGDTFLSTWAATSGDFYPRPPRGGRPLVEGS